MQRRQVVTTAVAITAAAGLAGCTGGDDDGSDDGDGGGDDPDNGSVPGDDPDNGSGSGDDPETGSSGPNDGSSPVDDGVGGGGGGVGGADDPEAAVQRYIEAGQDRDGDAMSVIVHPDGTAPTAPDEESTGEFTVNSMSLEEESDDQASVAVQIDVTFTLDGQEQTIPVETVYQVRTHEGSWFVYSRSGGL